ncbi:short-chain dehydrogenase/reductase SDR [Mycena filopes]|nr:short-chain dehydrogenase/reductase SDR [Mycena filopes]
MIRTILVTGANQGLGQHTVHQLAQTPGVVVFMGSRKIQAAQEALSQFASDVHASSTVVPVQLDVTDETSIKAAHSFIADHLKQKGISTLDVLINNTAAEPELYQPANGTVPATRFAVNGRLVTSLTVYGVNVFGTTAVTTAMRPLLANGGAILNISSGLGSLTAHTQRPAPPLYLAYNSSKAALNSLTLQWAIQEEEKGSGIRIVSICPGFNATSMTNYAGTMDPADGVKIIVASALAKEGKSGVFFDKDGPLEW